MGRRNYLIEGVSCSGKTSVATELNCRGYQAIHGDRVLAYQGDPQTGQPLEGSCHQHHIWDINKLRAYAEDQRQPVTFFCGGSRNFQLFLHLFDGVLFLMSAAKPYAAGSTKGLPMSLVPARKNGN